MLADSLSMHSSSTGDGGHTIANYRDQSISNWTGAIHREAGGARARVRAVGYDCFARNENSFST
jgi:hypothetical protein